MSDQALNIDGVHSALGAVDTRRAGPIARGSWARGRLGRISLSVLLVLSAGSVGFFFVIRSLVAGEEGRILHEHAGELALVLDQSIQTVATVLPLAGVVTSPGAGSSRSFDQV